MRTRRAIVVTVLGVLAVGAAAWLAWSHFNAEPDPAAKENDHAHEKPGRVALTPEALVNLDLDSKPLQLAPFTRSVEMPGVVVDRPGVSDRGVPAPVAGIVTQIYAENGVGVATGEPLFTIRVSSEYLQNAQAELYKTTSEMKRNRDFRKKLAEDNVVPTARLTELDQQHERLVVVARAHTQDLLSRGLTSQQIKEIERGDLVTDVRVVTPAPLPSQRQLVASGSYELAYEVQQIKVEVGHQVQAGQMLALLANHHSLAIEGKALPREAPLIDQAARQHWPLEVEFLGEEPTTKGTSPRQFTIRSVANTIPRKDRLLLFQVPFSNEGEPLERDGRTFLLWRYRPGQRVRLRVPVEKWEKVLVLPVGAVVKEGGEVFAFRRDGDAFDRKPVRLLFEDRQHVVLDPAKSGVSPGQHVAHQNAASLNRILKERAEGGHGHDHDHGH